MTCLPERNSKQAEFLDGVELPSGFEEILVQPLIVEHRL